MTYKSRNPNTAILRLLIVIVVRRGFEMFECPIISRNFNSCMCKILFASLDELLLDAFANLFAKDFEREHGQLHNLLNAFTVTALLDSEFCFGSAGSRPVVPSKSERQGKILPAHIRFPIHTFSKYAELRVSIVLVVNEIAGLENCIQQVKGNETRAYKLLCLRN